MENLSAQLAFFFSVVAYIPYVKAVLGSNARPTISSWISWGAMDIAILAGMIAQDIIAWQMVAYISGATCVIGVSIWKGAALGWQRLDTFCLSAAVVAIVLWYISGDPNVAIILSIIAFSIGTTPMLANIWKSPLHEPLLPWILFLMGGISGVMAIEKWNIASALTPAVFLFMQVIIVSLISRKFLREPLGNIS